MEALKNTKIVWTFSFCLILFFPLAARSIGIGSNNKICFKDTSRSVLKIFPGSSNSGKKTVLTFTVPNPSVVSIKIYDVEGREIAFLMDKIVPAGTFELFLETKNLRQGMYYCKIFTGDKVPMKKMIMVNR